MITLDEEQRLVANHTNGALVVVATAGSGKTTAITHRIANIVQTGKKSPEHGLALTFTNKAALELKHRLQTMSINALTTGTFHAVALRQLSYFWPQVFGGSIWPIQARTTILSTLTSRYSIAGRRYIEAEIDWLKSSGLDASAYVRLNRNGEVPAGDIAEIYGRYQDLTHSKRVIDFDDILQLTLGLLSNHPEILKEVRKRYTWFTVDEYQDVTPVQNALLQLWVGQRDDICVVGDPAQTIYTFAGARSEYLRDFWVADATRLQLTRTYRCPREVSSAAMSLMASSSTPVDIQSQGSVTGKVETLKCGNEYEEAQVVANRVKELMSNGVRPEEIAVLIRLTSMSQVFESAFENARIPYSMKGAKPFFERSEIKELLMMLRQEHEASTKNVKDLLLTIATQQGWSANEKTTSESVRQIWESITGLLNLADHLGAEVTLGDFFHQVALLSSQNLAPTESVVTISTLHSAKGLEWNHVFIPSVVESVLPYSIDAVDEERRLLFVGITRSKSTVTLTVPSERFTQVASPSRFLTEMKQSPTQSTLKVSAPELSKIQELKQVIKCRICQKGMSTALENALRRCHTCDGGSDRELLDQLTRWRTELASATNQIDWLVLTDVTLQALSELRPTSLEELKEIHGLNERNVAAFGDEILALILKRG